MPPTTATTPPATLRNWRRSSAGSFMAGSPLGASVGMAGWSRWSRDIEGVQVLGVRGEALSGAVEVHRPRACAEADDVLVLDRPEPGHRGGGGAEGEVPVGGVGPDVAVDVRSARQA